MQKKKLRIRKILIVFLLLIACLFTPFFSFSNNVVSAESENVTYTNVLEDLKKDENFNIDNYPVVENDYSIQVIQIAESKDRELFVYVYQPCVAKDLTATTISLSTAINNNAKWDLYNLKLLNKEATLLKYKVENFETLRDVIRYYDIPEIHRKWIKGVDEETGNDNDINEISFAVEKLWTACTINNETTYSVLDTETINITDKYVGFCRYGDGYGGYPSMGVAWYKPGYDAHFVAFSTDKPIDKLIEADVYYDIQNHSHSKKYLGYIPAGEEDEFGEIKTGEKINLKYDEKVMVVDHFGKIENKHEFNRIQSVEEFKKIENMSYVYNMGLFDIEREITITDDGLKELENKQWVLRFVETEYKNTSSINLGSGAKTKSRTIIGNVSILRLKFEHNGLTYNLGVVDNKQTEGDKPINKEDISINFDKLFKFLKILGIIGLVIIALVLLGLLLSVIPVLAPIGRGILAIFKGLWWILTIPYRVLVDE